MSIFEFICKKNPNNSSLEGVYSTLSCLSIMLGSMLCIRGLSRLLNLRDVPKKDKEGRQKIIRSSICMLFYGIVGIIFGIVAY